MAMQSFELAADQIIEIIDAERADASAVHQQQLLKMEAQCVAFRKSAYATHAANEAVNAQCLQEITQLRNALGGLERTLQQAGIHYSQGHLAFGPQWGALVHGLRGVAHTAPPLLMPREVMHALEAQHQEEEWRRDSAQNVRYEQPDRHDVYGPQFTEPNPNVYIPLLPSPNIDSKLSLKRRLGMASEGREILAKRSRWSTDNAPVMPTLGNNPGFNLPRPAFSQRTSCASSETHAAPGQSTRLLSPTSSSAPYDVLLTAPPVLEHWRCALIVPFIEARSPPPCILPPLSALVGAHACSYYMWFAIRSFLFRRLPSGDLQPRPVRTALSPEEWEVKLHNKKPTDGDVEYIYNEKIFARGGGHCACGMPPLETRIVRKLALRADDAPIEPADFSAPALQALICADLELAHAKLQFEQTDDAVGDALAWPAEQRVQRVEARRDIFRNGWDPSFAPAPLELPDVLARRPWIIRFRALLQDWPNFASTGVAPAAEDDTNALYLDALLTYEQRLIAFYLQTVSNLLGVHPARPIQRPDIGALPELYRHILAQD
ncbi:hypothetical protein DFH09DRAFT_1454310 [Mycena vulgaris]|nr:hypothetical protein DFH09DRAFT_1454310 [Mycena vulgaris]